ncbi:MAG: M48 family metallopeptidase [Sulfurifustis sp.]
MSAAPNTLRGMFYDGRTPQGLPATLIWSGATVKVIGSTLAQTYPTNKLRVSPRVGKANRFVGLPDGTQLQCVDQPLLDRFPQEGRTEGVVAWLESRWQVAVACIAIVLGGLAAGYFYGLPAAAERIAAEVPIEYERTLGEHALSWLDEHEWFHPTELAAEEQDELRAGFARLTEELPVAPNLRLEFRNAPAIGANAFALPGGTIVITDQMIELADTTEEIQAVLAHEIGHVEKRHALRHILQDSAVAVVVATLTSDASTFTAAVSGLPALLAQANYSRAFEAEADAYAFDLLVRRRVSPEHFATMMERLSAARDPAAERRLSFLSTHPVTADRIARARAAARQHPDLQEPDDAADDAADEPAAGGS